MGNDGTQANSVLSNLAFTHGNSFTGSSRPAFHKVRNAWIAFQRRRGTLFLGLLFCAGYLGVAAPKATASSGTLVFTPASLNFGTVAVGSSKTLTVAIANRGTATVFLSRESLVDNHYSVSGLTLPFSMSAGNTHTISVRFTPEAVGTMTG